MLAAVVALALSVSPQANLQVTVWPQGRTGLSWSRVVKCPAASARCRKLGALKGNPFAPPSPATFCTQIYGGPQEARVRGTFRGKRVYAVFTRKNGCEIARWDRVAFLFAK